MNQLTPIATLLTITDLVRILGKTKKTIYHLLSRHPEALPPRMKMPGRALRWHPEVVEAWIRTRAGLPLSNSTLPITNRGRGRPRKGMESGGR